MLDDGGGSPWPSAVASCERISESIWWVSRVLVQPAEARGGGLGSEVLGLLLAAFRHQGEPGAKLLVCPGGYENDQERQRRFYLKNGFVPAPEFDSTALVWAPVKEAASAE